MRANDPLADPRVRGTNPRALGTNPRVREVPKTKRTPDRTRAQHIAERIGAATWEISRLRFREDMPAHYRLLYRAVRAGQKDAR